MSDTRAWMCSFATFGLRSDPEYTTEEMSVPEHADPYYVTFSYRVMKGLVVEAVIIQPDPPTREQFSDVVLSRVNQRLPEVVEPEADQ